MPKIFISYRRSDSPWAANRIYDRLVDRYGPANLFKDTDSIMAGQPFPEHIAEWLTSSDVVVVIIGAYWTVDRDGNNRLFLPHDWVRQEIAMAFVKGIPVLPILIDDTPEIAVAFLPPDLTPLTQLQYLRITNDPSFARDIQRLVAQIDARFSRDDRPSSLTQLQRRVNAIDGIALVLIPPGVFEMGRVRGDEDFYPDEEPQHLVEISRAFWMASTPVTVKCFKAFSAATQVPLPPAPDFNVDWIKDDHPIVRVTWSEADAYSRWVGGRLPTEAEWEYAARGGASNWKYPWGNSVSYNRARCRERGPTSVASYPPNQFGLYDIIGNVMEWTSDWHDGDYYEALASKSGPRRPTTDPTGPPRPTDGRILRGGSWYFPLNLSRISWRFRLGPEVRDFSNGFRYVIPA